MFKHISLITSVKIGDISTARSFELLFEIVYQDSMNFRFI